MIITLLAGVFASSLITSSLPATPNVVAYQSIIPTQSQAEYSNYVVQEGDYLSKIAEAYYGSEDYWTNIWNDNPEVKDAWQLEKGVVLKVRENKTAMPEILNPELISRQAQDPEAAEDTYVYDVNSGASLVQSVSIIGSTDVAPTQVQQPVAPQAVASSAPQSLTDAQITALGSCEAGMDPAKNTGNGYYGAFQFSAGTWNSMGTGYERADLAPIDVQKAAVQRLVARSSIYTQFPGCAQKMRSNGVI